MFIRRIALTCFAAAFAALSFPAAQAATLVTNGNFSAGLTGWTSSDWFTGPGYASTGCVGLHCITGPAQAFLEQSVATTPGDSYTLMFSYNPGPGTPTELKVLFGSLVATDLINVPNSFVGYTVTGLIASSNSTLLEFLGRQDPSFNLLTNVSLTDDGPSGVAATPEPSSLLLLATGLFGGARVIRRRF